MVEIPPVQRKIIDITIPISPSMQVFPGDPRPSIERVCTLEKEGFSLSGLSLGSHTGTHVDAPSHVLDNGQPVDKLELENLIGKALLLDFTSYSGSLTADILEKSFQKTGVSKNIKILLLKTLKTEYSSGKQKNTEETNSQSEKSNFQDGEYKEGEPDSVYLEESAAKWIIGKGFKTIGVDSFSVDSLHSENLPVHHILLSSKVNIVECLDLSSVETGIYFFLCLPLKIEGCDGAPARALLIFYP
jgi:kynurenine formamidase